LHWKGETPRHSQSVLEDMLVDGVAASPIPHLYYPTRLKKTGGVCGECTWLNCSVQSSMEYE